MKKLTRVTQRQYRNLYKALYPKQKPYWLLIYLLSAGLLFLYVWQRAHVVNWPQFATVRQMANDVNLAYAMIATGLMLAPIFIYQLTSMMALPPQQAVRYTIDKHRIDQRVLEPKEVKRLYPIKKDTPMIPVASLEKNPATRWKFMIGATMPKLDTNKLTIAPIGRGKGMTITETGLAWDRAWLCVDPKGEQLERIGGERAKIGPVYQICLDGGQGLNLANYFDMAKPEDRSELHKLWLKPHEEARAVFVNKSIFLFEAAYHYAMEHDLNPIRVLLQMAKAPAKEALCALHSVDPSNVLAFTNAKHPSKDMDNFAASAWGSFQPKILPYYQSVQSVVTDRLVDIPVDWVDQRATIFITYPFSTLKAMNGLVSSIITALARHHETQGVFNPWICTLDEAPAVALPGLPTFMNTARSTGLYFDVYAQSYSQLLSIYGQDTRTIVASCDNQAWFRPADRETADYMSGMMGTKIEVSTSFSDESDKDRMEFDFGSRRKKQSYSLVSKPRMSPKELEAMPVDNVIVKLGADTFQAYRPWPVPKFDSFVPFTGHLPGIKPLPDFKWSGAEAANAAATAANEEGDDQPAERKQPIVPPLPTFDDNQPKKPPTKNA